MNFFKNLYQRLFRFNQTYLVFLVEDDVVYAKLLEAYLQKNLYSDTEIMYFPVGELAVENLHLKPDLVIMDYQLNSKYPDAENGLENIRKIRIKLPKADVILLSSQKKIEVAVEAMQDLSCSYVVKDEKAFSKLSKIINRKIRDKEEKTLVKYEL